VGATALSDWFAQEESMTRNAANFEVLEGFAEDVLAIAAHGRITRQDYEDVLMPAFEQKVAAKGKVKVLFVMGEDFTGYSAGAAWDDAKFGFLHMRELAALAVVTDATWLRLGLKAFAPLIACPVALFHTDEMQAATTWINEWKHPEGAEPGIDVAGRLPTLEDKG
jgi:hypothetical protein